MAEITGYHTHVIKLGTPKRPTYWPAWIRPDGVLVDLRMHAPSGCGNKVKGEQPIYHAGCLRAAGVPELYIEAAATSDPPGFVLLPQGAL